MTFKATLLAGTATALIALAGMAVADGHATHPVTGDVLASDQSFTYRVLDDFPSIDPQLIQDVSGSEVARDLFEGLMNEDAEGNVIPGVATGYEVSEDGLVYTFTLREDAKWSDGVQVTAQQFVDGIKRAADPATASEYAWFLGVTGIVNAEAVTAGEMPVDALGVRAIDDLTLEITIDAPRPYFPQTTTFPTLFPARLDVIEANGDDWTDPANIVSNGAYVLEEYVPQERLVRVRNEMYWNNDATIIDQVTALIINDENAALTRYLAGELDMTDIPAGQFPRLSEEYPDQAISFPNSCSYYYMFNLSDSGLEALQDVRVRQALSMAVDRDIIVDNVLAGGQRAAYTFTHWAIPGWEVPDIPMANMTQAERNEQAKALIAEAGYGEDNPLEVEIVYNTSDSHRAIAVAISQMWKQTLGVEATLANQEWATYLDTRGEQNYEIARGGWCADYAEPSTYLDLFTTTSSYNDGKYSNAEVDALMQEAKLSEDPLPLYQRVEEIAAADAAIIPIYHYASVRMMSANLENWPTENLLQNWYSRDLYISASE
ncbi:peptide ABC transporter substrate-binding protein [Ponticoccus sp. SC2-23]|uniref:peptide ABC transporter substrate-binding protein n=1 Tax=Alexandriicola marinus TaxID=2081710 RepID=UPI000FDBD97F|nr:peptide ABC transporter substrate-binding protein [Alexandriicola marinus]MBM1221500.1 peptide ABC transporter substrate-binding protein [Ponticoccus sp. SC6-9]MBM1226541.1 peptide ABC transporter substrate-binding protein [Ponticoccus sp. SC6-15]MBM1230492.1 peptide ABC transporter substrate-binding protein [Ponticoccus sp. SC6-38]MBM1235015.1 peptide ABC transporter substrate-binding protein [Ponticoccus sp. SC6-45]MBM1239513.1 peptide ABC transporter substrate-binding protein [Ponticoccu